MNGKFRALAQDWELFGQTDPLFGILSDPAKYGGKWDVNEFFESGRAHVKKLFDTLASLDIEYGSGACLDFGCGVGRLTVPLSEPFGRTVGVDVAPSMIQRAREFHRARARCEFVVNRAADLGQFRSGTFDLVHSCLVLQHMAPELSLGYVSEFFRVAKEGGLVVFQLPAEQRSESAVTAMHALPDAGYAGRIAIADAPDALPASAAAAVRVALTNASPVAWPHDIPAGRHISVANHWLREDGTTLVPDDGRSRLPHTIAPGESVEVSLNVIAPATAGRYLLEIDLVQEMVCWFGQKGSPTARVPMMVREAPPGRMNWPADRGNAQQVSPRDRTGGRGASLFNRVFQRLRPNRRPSFSMYSVPRAEVEALIRASGGRLIAAIDDNAAGASWCSYTYICRAGGQSVTRSRA
jgi:SAM-dependent methyltransferase